MDRQGPTNSTSCKTVKLFWGKMFPLQKFGLEILSLACHFWDFSTLNISHLWSIWYRSSCQSSTYYFKGPMSKSVRSAVCNWCWPAQGDASIVYYRSYVRDSICSHMYRYYNTISCTEIPLDGSVTQLFTAYQYKVAIKPQESRGVISFKCENLN